MSDNTEKTATLRPVPLRFIDESPLSDNAKIAFATLLKEIQVMPPQERDGLLVAFIDGISPVVGDIFPSMLKSTAFMFGQYVPSKLVVDKYTNELNVSIKDFINYTEAADDKKDA